MRYLKKAPAPDSEGVTEVSDAVERILADIYRRGEPAVRDYSHQLDEWDPESFRVPDTELETAGDAIPPDLRDSIDFAIEQVRAFAEAQRAMLTDLEVETRPGVFLGHRQIPVDRVGAYVPGGRYSLIASCYMSVVPARVAGVGEIVVCALPRGDRMPPGLLYAARRSGADAVYSLGGVQALAAMAYGAVPGMAPVDMLVGPGNRYVIEAKRQLFGQVGIDLLAGPTEIGVLADRSADPFVVACDLVGQAEHDPHSRAILVTTSPDLGQAVLDQMEEHLSAIETADVARQCWHNGGEVVVVKDEDELVAASDAYALEHVEVLTVEPERVAGRLRHYGSLFVGEEATVAYGDKTSGPNHILPTGRSARFTGGLSVANYLKTVTFQRMDRSASIEMARHCEAVSGAEGMVSHARTGAVRRQRYGDAART